MDSEAPDDNAMAIAMGFSSFGHQNPQKKRKYNHQTDAVSDITPRPSGTGSNMTPLGKPKPKPSGSTNVEEINLDDDAEQAQPLDTEATTSGPQMLPHHSGLPSRPPPVEAHPSSGHAGLERKRHEPRNNGNPWYEGYYDPTSNQNPWERLEQRMGLESQGSWVSKGAWKGTAGGG